MHIYFFNLQLSTYFIFGTRNMAECISKLPEMVKEGTKEQNATASDGKAQGDAVNMESKPSTSAGETEVKGDSAANAPITDPYHYTKGEEFTSEIYKIEIRNLPRYFGFTVSAFLFFLYKM